MAYYEFLFKDMENNRDTLVSQGEVEYLGDVLELFKTFLHGCGYTYVGKVIIESDDGFKTWETA